jgi:hypothetical protein
MKQHWCHCVNSAKVMFTKIISGGQTGVDRAALDVALELGISCGGWCPRGRRAADGAIPLRYPLLETPSRKYPQRTAWNVHDSDGTLVLSLGEPTGGTAFTIRCARKHGKPVFVVDLCENARPGLVKEWAESHHVRVLNIAGPREREKPGVYDQARRFLNDLLGDK